jgi:hypothetical protein
LKGTASRIGRKQAGNDDPGKHRAIGVNRGANSTRTNELR